MQTGITTSDRIRGYLDMAVSSTRFITGKMLRRQQMLLNGFLGYIASRFNTDPRLQDEMKGTQGWINLKLGMKSADESAKGSIAFINGRVSVFDEILEDVESVIVFSTPDALMKNMDASPDEAYRMILTGMVRTEKNMMLTGLFSYYVNLVIGKDQQKAVDKQILEHREANQIIASDVEDKILLRKDRPKRKTSRMRGTRVDPGVRYLDDPYLSDYDLEDFPRLERFRAEYFSKEKEATVCHEYGKLLTDFHIEQGFEYDKDGKPWDPNLRKAESFKYILERKKPLIRTNDLLAGTFTTDPLCGCVGHPFSLGLYSWGELRSFANRELMPYNISEETIQVLHKHVFPYWAKKNIHELWRDNTNNDLPVQIHDRLFAVFYYKTVSMSEISPGYEKIIQLGTNGLITKIKKELNSDAGADLEKKNTLQSMIIGLEAINTYAGNLARQAYKEAMEEKDARRKAELMHMHQVLSKVPANPSETMDEAVQALAITHICLGMESTDDGPAFGRLDQILQPFFRADMEKLRSLDEREDYVKHVIDLLGCLYFRQASHQILLPDIGNWQNSGSAPNACITLGGVTPEGDDAVNDMTYIFLKVTELLGLNDPNMHARFKPDKNSLMYLKRACEVNYITGATPCIHGDDAVITSLAAHGWEIEDVRGYVATGCVEPSLPGKLSSATSTLEINLVAPLEMAMNQGRHPLTNWTFGPKTGCIEKGDFPTFEEFWNAFSTQVGFIVEQSVIGNNQLGEIYQRYQPAPLLSSLLDGCIESGRGLTRGGAKYNSSGATIIGLTDVVDSLMAIKKLIFEDRLATFSELKAAVDTNYTSNPRLHALVMSRITRFGSGNEEAVAMANRVTHLVHESYKRHSNYRGGIYTTGWWSMANHSAYGRVTGALPSARLAGEPFTPGLTPHPSASANLLDNLRDVARLDPIALDNSIAFNVKVVPGASETSEQIVETMASYAKTYFEMGGMQTQYNVVTTKLLKDALANPEHYRDLIVRISGYVAYFTKIQRDLQLEVIRRAEYGI